MRCELHFLGFEFRQGGQNVFLKLHLTTLVFWPFEEAPHYPQLLDISRVHLTTLKLLVVDKCFYLWLDKLMNKR